MQLTVNGPKVNKCRSAVLETVQGQLKQKPRRKLVKDTVSMRDASVKVESEFVKTKSQGVL